MDFQKLHIFCDKCGRIIANNVTLRIALTKLRTKKDAQNLIKKRKGKKIHETSLGPWVHQSARNRNKGMVNPPADVSFLLRRGD